MTTLRTPGRPVYRIPGNLSLNAVGVAVPGDQSNVYHRPSVIRRTGRRPRRPIPARPGQPSVYRSTHRTLRRSRLSWRPAEFPWHPIQKGCGFAAYLNDGPMWSSAPTTSPALLATQSVSGVSASAGTRAR